MLCVSRVLARGNLRKGGFSLAKNTGNGLVKVLALAGTVLVWLPILLTILSSGFGLIIRRSFHLDFLMPAELFPLAFVGALTLVLMAFKARCRRKAVAFSGALMVVFFACVLFVPLATGLASGATPPEGWPWALSLLSLALYAAAMVLTGVAGTILTRDLFRKGVA